MVDDVEIVAVSTSSLSRDEGSANGEEDVSYSNNKFGRYVPSPTKKGKQRHGSKGGNPYATSGTGSNTALTPGSGSSASHKQQQQQQLQALPPDQQQQQQSSSATTSQHPATTSPKRLLKSVQIFLRERSTGNV
jgi:hypothetical protein